MGFSFCFCSTLRLATFLACSTTDRLVLGIDSVKESGEVNAWKGVQTFCSSSLASVRGSAHTLWRGDASMVVARDASTIVTARSTSFVRGSPFSDSDLLREPVPRGTITEILCQGIKFARQ